MAGYVHVRAYAELNDFLDADSRSQTLRRPCGDHQTVRTCWRPWAFHTPRST